MNVDRPAKLRRTAAQSQDGQSSRAEMLDRMRRAKKYQQKPAEESALISELPIAASNAARDEEIFTAALAEQQQASAAEERAGGVQPQRPSVPLPQKSVTGEGLRDAAMRRIAAARRYAADRNAAGPVPQQQSRPAAGAAESSSVNAGVGSSVEWGSSGMGSAQEVCCSVLVAHINLIVPVSILLDACNIWTCRLDNPAVHNMWLAFAGGALLTAGRAAGGCQRCSQQQQPRPGPERRAVHSWEGAAGAAAWGRAHHGGRRLPG